MSRHVIRFRSLTWRLSATLILILVVLAGIYVYITAFTAEMYFQEANQRLNGMVASHIAGGLHPFVDGKVDETALKRIFDDVMVLNPSLEVYLLDSLGRILAYSAPDSLIKRRSVSLDPIQAFLKNGNSSFVLGDDPRSTTREKVFSVARIQNDQAGKAYLYVILGGQEYDSVMNIFLGSYILRLGLRAIGLTLIGAALIGLVAFRFITRSLRSTIATVKEFKKGNLTARITPGSGTEVNELAVAFNEMADKLVAQIEEIRSMDVLRRDLVANVSHDLRTPLVSIHGYVETILMKDKTLSVGERERYLRTVLQGTEKLKKLVEELFELSKLEAKQVAPSPERFSLAELVQDVVQKHQIIAEQKGLRIATEFPRDLPFVVADIALMERVFQNLVDNAVKFTEAPGTITITLTPKGGRVSVDVADTGDGIPADELPHIFDRYRRGAVPRKGDDSGGGLGLAIVKKILEIQGITISVTSKVKEGTAFSFQLPSESHFLSASVAAHAPPS
jgi:signal transduction histidine kinase